MRLVYLNLVCRGFVADITAYTCILSVLDPFFSLFLAYCECVF